MLHRDTAFKISMLLPLSLLLVYFLLLISSQASFFSLATFFEQLSSGDLRSAVALSLFAATISHLPAKLHLPQSLLSAANKSVLIIVSKEIESPLN